MANIVMLGWPFVVLAIFATMRREPALIWSIIAGYLVLPESYAFNFPGLPPVDKYFMLFVPAMIAMVLFRPKPGNRAAQTLAQDVAASGDRLAGRIFWCLTIALFAGTVATYVLNGAPVRSGGASMPGVTPYDGLAQAFDIGILFGPYFLARRYLADARSHKELLRILVTAGMAYSLLALFEIRMSPQLNVWVYGYFQHDWRQHIRGDGFRPLVFLRHGLWLGFFFFMVIIAAFAMSRAEPKTRLLFLFAGVWVLATLALSKAVGAFLITLLLVPVALVLPVRQQILVGIAAATFFVAYPVLRPTGLLPLEKVVAAAESYSRERAASLIHRLNNEALLLERANEKPVFGWAGFGRWRHHDDSGKDVTTSDGIWIIVLGQRGWIGYVSFFGLLIFPMFLMRRAGRRKEVDHLQSGMILILGGNLIYMLPNSTLNPVTMLLAGALAGFAQFDHVRDAAEGALESGEPVRSGTRYSRFRPRPQTAEPAPRRVPRKSRRRVE